ncbi:MAG: LamG-like jellyroll fold domain-containing protein [Marmoricola sp.]
MAAVSFAVVLTSLAYAPSSSADDLGAQSPSSTAADPFERAVTTGDPVEIVDERTETSTAWANPDGTKTFDLSAVPVRVQDDSGDWIEPNYDLEFDGGNVVPKASDIDLQFSGGTGDMVQVANDEDQSLALKWPGDLPAPTLDGPTATYSDVLPGVDLMMTAVPGGYRQVLRVNTPEAAQNPDLDKLRFDADVPADETVKSVASGGAEVTDESGAPAFVATQPTMWDSAGSVADQGSEQVAGEGDNIQQMAVSASDDAIVVTPNQSMLDNPATVYPVYIDPTIHDPATGGTGRTMVQKEYPTTEFYNWDNNSGYGEGVGYQNASGVSTKRLIFEYSLSSIPNDATVVKAEFTADETHAWSCTKAAVVLDRVGLISSSTNWNNQPALIGSGHLASSDIQVREGTGTGDCRSVTTTLGFGLDSGDTLDTAVESAIPANSIALRLKADESSALGWKRFLSGAKLIVTVNRPPGVPTGQTFTATAGGHACSNWIAIGSDVGGLSSSVRATVSDPDSDLMDVKFDFQRYDPSAAGYVDLGLSWDTDQANGYAAHTMPSAVNTEARYIWNATARDQYTDFKNVAHATYGPTTAWCYFYTDTTNPKIGVTASLSQADGTSFSPAPSDDTWLDPGHTLRLTLDPLDSKNLYDNKNDVVSYQVTSDVPALNRTVAAPSLGAAGTLDIDTSQYDGEHWVNVNSVDRSGRTSAIVTRNFRIRGAVQVARYKLDEGAGTTANSVEPGLPAFVVNGAPDTTWATLVPAQTEPDGTVDVPANTYLHFNNGNGGAHTTTRIVDDTHAFAVSAWAKASDVTKRHVVVSQQTVTGGAFSLAIEPGCGSACAVFTIWDSTGASQSVRSTAPVIANHWYVLAGSFDDLAAPVGTNPARTHQIRVWTTDETSEPGPVAPVTVNLGTTFTPAAATATTLGYEATPGYATNGWAGDVEDVRFYTDEVSWLDVSNHILTYPQMNQLH